ncbi:3'-phosphoadenosine 5'-phosphosulfate sulfotransferase [Elasticomyces elasticus]|nr:3'-phosphoadenosine 5'-phosphosulfate sulfotransferase [Elasticomyces elasticus]
MPEVQTGVRSHHDDDTHNTATITENASGAEDGSGVEGQPVPLPLLCERIHRRVYAFLEAEAPTEALRRVQEQTRTSLGVIAEALERYSLRQLSISYNGGKDCLVLLILYLCALHTHATRTPPASNSSALPPTIQSVYVVSQHPFPQVEAFVASSMTEYHLDLARYASPMKEAIQAYLHDTRDAVKAIFVGTRRTDPHGAELTFFDQTDRGWPAFMRVHPVIDWHYVEIWTFIRHLQIPYCPLYDLGYTSLGGTTDTHPNPALKAATKPQSADAEETQYRPAYELVEDDEERLGRDR